MLNKLNNSIKKSLKIFLISASLNCLYPVRPKINYPIEIDNYRFEKVGTRLIYIDRTTGT